jgi:hypothetical protein
LLVLDILITEKSRIRDRFISYSKYSRRGTLFIQKKVGSALTETENWKKGIFSPFIKKRIWFFFFITLERSNTRQDKFESILEIIESVVSSPFVKAEVDSVEYFVLCLKRYVRLLHHCILNDRLIACSWYINNRKKPHSWSFCFLFKKFQTRDIIHSEKSGICSDGNRKLGFACWLYKSIQKDWWDSNHLLELSIPSQGSANTIMTTVLPHLVK